MSTTRLVLLIVGLLTTAVGGLASAVAGMRMVDEINRQRPPAVRDSPYWWTGEKTWRVLGEYRRLAPDGPLWPLFVIATSAAIVGVVLSALSLGIIS